MPLYIFERGIEGHCQCREINSNIHCKKSLAIFPSPVGMSLSDITAGDGKILTFFYSVLFFLISKVELIMHILIITDFLNLAVSWKKI
jgi:hypothetical protein